MCLVDFQTVTCVLFNVAFIEGYFEINNCFFIKLFSTCFLFLCVCVLFHTINKESYMLSGKFAINHTRAFHRFTNCPRYARAILFHRWKALVRLIPNCPPTYTIISTNRMGGQFSHIKSGQLFLNCPRGQLIFNCPLFLRAINF